MSMVRALCVCAVLVCAAVASAGMVTILTPSGATNDGNAVSASAEVILGTDHITITLRNLQADPTSVSQNISDFAFRLTTGETGATLLSSEGLERTINSNRTYVDGSVVSTGWAIDHQTYDSNPGWMDGFIRLHVLGTPAGPAHTIIGDAAANSLYTHAGGSIKGNGPHNPFLAGEVTFELSVPGVTDDTQISRAIFSFGTTEGHNVHWAPPPPSSPPAVPLSSSMLMGGLGLIALGAMRIRRWYADN